MITQTNLAGTKKNTGKRVINLILASALMCIFFSCDNSPKPESVATDFLNAYLSTDYEKAASFCTPGLAEYLNEAVKELDNLNDEIKNQIQKHTRYYTPRINSVTKVSKGDTIWVNYSIINTGTKDSLSTGSQITESVLSIVKQENNWKVAALNNI